VTVEVADDHWRTASNGNWSSDPHWTLASPAASMTAVIDANAINGTNRSYTVTISQPAVAAALIINDAKATVRDDASLTLSGALTVNSGTFELNNGSLLAQSIFIGLAGTFLVSHGSYVISEPIVDYGTIEVARDSLEIAGTISGTGVFQIDQGATLQLDGADSLNVIFTGSTGELVLGDPSEFTGNIIGLSGSDTIDLTNLVFGTNTKVTGVTYSTATNITTLTVTDGTNVDTIQLVGDYTGSTWTLSSDGSGGTLLIDPATTSDLTLVTDAEAASSGSLTDVALGSVTPFENALASELNTMLAPYQPGLIPLQQLIQDVTNGQNPLANNGSLQAQIIDLTNGHNPVADPTSIVGAPLGGGILLPGGATTSDAALIAIAEAPPGGSPPAVALGPVLPTGNAQTLELNTTPAASQDGLSQLQQVVQGATGGQNAVATNGDVPAQLVDLTNGHTPVAEQTTVVELPVTIAHHDFLIHA
jgi:hypothetical protein